MAAAVAAIGATLLDGSSASAVTPVLTPVYLPIPPFRWFDSRHEGIKVTTGEEWKLTATPHANDLAYAFNVTVTSTVGKGWLAVYPGDATFDGTSSINWFGNDQDLANNAYTGFEPSDSGVHIRCGGGGTRTHFILDLTAILVLIDLSTVVTAQRSPLDVASLASTPSERAHRAS